MTMPGTTPSIPYRLSRRGVVMTPQDGDPNEAEGVLNPLEGDAEPRQAVRHQA